MIKKDYQKPALFAERFELMEHIADNCSMGKGASANYRNSGECSYTDANVTLFLTDTVNGRCGGSGYSYDTDLYDSWDDYAERFRNDSECYNAFNNGLSFAS